MDSTVASKDETSNDEVLENRKRVGSRKALRRVTRADVVSICKTVLDRLHDDEQRVSTYVGTARRSDEFSERSRIALRKRAFASILTLSIVISIAFYAKTSKVIHYA